MTDNNKEKDLEVFEADSNKEVIKNEDPANKKEETEKTDVVETKEEDQAKVVNGNAGRLELPEDVRKKSVIGTNSYKEHGTSKECKMVVGFIL